MMRLAISCRLAHMFLVISHAAFRDRARRDAAVFWRWPGQAHHVSHRTAKSDLLRQEFVLAASARCQRRGILLPRLPTSSGDRVYATLVPSVIILESFLSFLGLAWRCLGASWCRCVAVVNPIRSYWWLLVWPSAFLGVTLLSLNFVGDGLRDALDPKART